MLRHQSQEANHASHVIGPRAASVLQVRGRWPDGGCFNLAILLLGERRTPAPSWLDPPAGHMTATQLFQAATYRGLARGRCVDLFIEQSIQRAITTDHGGHSRPSRELDPSASTLERVRHELDPCVPHARQIREPTPKGTCPLGPSGRRVHYFDTRATEFLDASQSHVSDALACWHRGLEASDDVPDWMSTELTLWMRFFMGLDPEGGFSERAWSPRVLAPFQARYFEDNPDYMAAFLRVQGVGRARVRRRAARLGMERARWLAHHVATTADSPESLELLLANASDLYLMLRLMSPYVARPGSPCVSGVARCCIVYAGVRHTRHVQRAVGSMLGVEWSMPSVQGTLRAKEVVAEDVEANDEVGPWFGHWGEVLAAIGLPDPDSVDVDPVWRQVRVAQLDDRVRVSYDHNLVRVTLYVETRVFQSGAYYQLPEAVGCPVRLAAFYSGDPSDRSAPRAPPGTARRVLGSVLRFMQARGLVRPEECIVLEADGSPGGGLRRFYERLGFEVLGVAPLETQDGDTRAAIDRGALMRAPVALVIQRCEAGLTKSQFHEQEQGNAKRHRQKPQDPQIQGGSAPRRVFGSP